MDRTDIFIAETGENCCLTGGAELKIVGLLEDHALAKVSYPDEIEIYPGHRMAVLLEHRPPECRTGQVIAVRKSVWRDIVRSWTRWVDEKRSDDARYDREQRRADLEKKRVLEEYRGTGLPPTEQPQQ